MREREREIGVQTSYKEVCKAAMNMLCDMALRKRQRLFAARSQIISSLDYALACIHSP